MTGSTGRWRPGRRSALAVAAVAIIALGAIAPTMGSTGAAVVESTAEERIAQPDTSASQSPTASVVPRPACTSVQDCLDRMTLDEKIGQMTQVNHRALISDSDIADHALGSLLAGGGGSPTTGNSPRDWADMVDHYQSMAGAVMPSFSSWNGSKLHGHEYLLTDVLRSGLGFSGLVISDWAGIDQLPGDYASDVRTAINAGIDMVMVPDDYRRFQDTLRAEIEAGNIPMGRIDEAVSRILEAKFGLGLFERPFADRTSIDDIGSPAHREVARQAVRESLVLLENDGLLPLPRTDTDIFVAGANADDIGNQSGGWTISWQGSSGDSTPGTTILEAIEASVGPGSTVTFDRRASGEISGDIGLVVVGEQPYAEGRGDDWDLTLSDSDTDVIERVCDAMPCVVILVSGRPMMITHLLPTTNAFVAAWLPGTEGQGVADVLFGDFDFSGTLPMTWPKDIDQVPINVGDADYDPLFPFGFGLDYES